LILCQRSASTREETDNAVTKSGHHGARLVGSILSLKYRMPAFVAELASGLLL
jgi:hypothetical protein